MTRATIGWRATGAFLRESRRQRDHAANAPGVLRVLGFGERPVGELGTLSIWETAEHAAQFSQSAAHRHAAETARTHRWFDEEMFSVFAPLASGGTWAGSNPLDDAME